jgi:hypothetical protein
MWFSMQSTFLSFILLSLWMEKHKLNFWYLFRDRWVIQENSGHQGTLGEMWVQIRSVLDTNICVMFLGFFSNPINNIWEFYYSVRQCDSFTLHYKLSDSSSNNTISKLNEYCIKNNDVIMTSLAWEPRSHQ